MTEGVSIVIRTWNEQETLSKLLDQLQSQHFDGDIQIIVVDNESTDGTTELAKSSGAQVITIKKEEFTYPKSMNMGVAAAKYPVVFLTVGHALPENKNWISSATNHFQDEGVAGVYSPVLPNSKHTLAEALTYYPNFLFTKIRSPFVVKHRTMGVMGAMNCALLKRLWEEHHFDERYELGGEDGEWASWAMKQGYKIVCDAKMLARHSHYQGIVSLTKQFFYWRKLSKPTKFNRKALKFRKDLTQT